MNQTYLNENQLLQSAIKLANQWRIQGLWQDALTLLNGIHPLAEKIDDAARAQVYLNIGRVLTEEGMFAGKDNLATQHQALEQALTIAQQTENKRLLGDIYDALGFSTHAAYLAGDRSEEPKEELGLFERGLKLRKEAGTPSQIAESLFHVGLVYDVVRKEYDKAMPYHEEAYELAMESGDKITASYAIRHMGFAHIANKDFEAATDALTKSLTLREEAGFIPGAAFALVALAHVNMMQENKDEAQKFLVQARDLLVPLEATARVEWLDGHIASLNE
ncbi:MAG: hypothetical protein AAF490_20445 [Chloroflexota bacterium]